VPAFRRHRAGFGNERPSDTGSQIRNNCAYAPVARIKQSIVQEISGLDEIDRRGLLRWFMEYEMFCKRRSEPS
jgi:hypothetical protein